MSNKYDSILGAYRQADTVDLSGYVPYTGASQSIDLNGQSILNTGALLVNQSSPYDNSVAFETYGKGGFWSGNYLAYFADSNAPYAGYFNDGLTTTEICNGTYGVSTTGAILAGGIVDSSGYYIGGVEGYFGDLNDSTSTKIADVVGGIITAVYF